jgi:L-aminopeptidase/D-esterase-like protein
VTITDVPGIRVGHWSDQEAATGCTVVLLPPEGAVASVDVRGPAPGTRETDLLEPGRFVERVHAICLSGGSAFGLGAADGVMRYLRERGIGVQAGPAKIPIVPGAVIFDLNRGSGAAFPGPEEGYAASVDAERHAAGELEQGRVGAATGATVGKLRGIDRSLPGGLGSAALRLPGGALVGALAVVNALGDVVDQQGRLVAGVGGVKALLEEGLAPLAAAQGTSTTLAVVATDAALDKAQCRMLASLAHDGLAHAIRPRTFADGDTVFFVSTGGAEAEVNSLAAAAVETLRRSVVAAVARG